MIVALQDGCVVETGTHEELFSKKKVYYSLVMLQTIAEKVAEEEDADDLSMLGQEDKGRHSLVIIIIMNVLQEFTSFG